jgi:3-oxoacyl-[acyl-carrier protein] reductase
MELFSNKALQGKTVLITGATRGIGKAIATIFAFNGARMILTGRNIHLLEDLKSSLQTHTEDHMIFEMDVDNVVNIKDVFSSLNHQKIIIDCLVNNAGVMKDATLMMSTTKDLNDTFSTNVFGTIETTKFALKSLIKNKKGSIINISSIIGIHGAAGQSVYSSSKSAILGFTKSLSKELASLNIRVNAIAPGFIETDLTAGRDYLFYEKNISNIGMKRFGTPEDVAMVALFLASDSSNYVTGQTIGVDGGMSI